MTKKELQAGEIRLEDLGKQLLKDAEPIDFPIVKNSIYEYIVKHEANKVFLLYSKELGYFQLFYDEDDLGVDATAAQISSFLEESSFITNTTDEDPKYLNFSENVTFIEDEEGVLGLSIWFSTHYFQLTPYDMGLEIIGK